MRCLYLEHLYPLKKKVKRNLLVSCPSPSPPEPFLVARAMGRQSFHIAHASWNGSNSKRRDSLDGPLRCLAKLSPPPMTPLPAAVVRTWPLVLFMYQGHSIEVGSTTWCSSMLYIQASPGIHWDCVPDLLMNF